MAANRIKGITIEIGGDTTDLSKSLQGVNDTLKKTQSSLKDVNNLLKLDPTNVTLLEQKQDLLATSIDKTKEKLDTLKFAQENFNEDLKNTEEGQRQYQALEREIVATEQTLKGLETQMAETTSAIDGDLDETEQGFKDIQTASGETETEVKSDINGIETEVKELNAELDNTKAGFDKMSEVGGSLQTLGNDVKAVGDALAPLSALAAAFGGYAIKSSADYEAAMDDVQAKSGATEEEMQMLNEVAMSLGKDMKYSTTDAAEALSYMALAGWDANEMADGLAAVMYTAGSSGEDLAQVSDILTDDLTAFGLSASDAEHFANVLAETSRSANTDISTMGETFKFAGSLAGALGYSVDDAAAAVGIMANSGIKGSQAGTALRSALSNLVNPSKSVSSAMHELGLYASHVETVFKDDASMQQYARNVEKAALSVQSAQNAYSEACSKYGEDSEQAANALIRVEQASLNLESAEQKLWAAQQGKDTVVLDYNEALVNEDGTMKSLQQTIDFLREKFSGLSEDEKAQAASAIFGKNAMSGMLALINASDEDWENLRVAIADCDGATTSYIDDMGNLVSVQKDAEDATNGLGTAQSMYATQNDNLKGDVTQLMSSFQVLAQQIGDQLTPKIRTLVQDLKGFVDKLINTDDKTKENIAKFTLFVAALAPVLKIVGKATSGFGTLLKTYSKIAPVVKTLTSSFGGLGGIFSKLVGFVNPVTIAIGALSAVIVTLWNKSESFRNTVTTAFESVRDKLKECAEELSEEFGGLGEIFQNVGSVISEAWTNACLLIEPLISALVDSFGQLVTGGLDVVTNAIIAVSRLLTGDFTGAWEAAKEGVSSVVDTIVGIGTSLYEGLKQVIIDIGNIFGIDLTEAFTTFETFVSEWIGRIKFFFETTLPVAWAEFKLTAESLWETVKTKWNEFWTWCDETFFAPLKKFFGEDLPAAWEGTKLNAEELWTTVQTKWEAFWTWLDENFGQPIAQFFTAVGAAIDAMRQKWEEIWDTVKTKWEEFMTWLDETFIQPIAQFFADIHAAIDAMRQEWEDIWDTIQTKWNEFMTWLDETFVQPVEKFFNETVPNAIGDARQAFVDLPGNIQEALANISQYIKDAFQEAIDFLVDLPNQALQWGKDFIAGFKKGIDEKVQGVIDSVKGIGNNIRELLHFSRPDKGALRDYETWMPDFMQGLATGIQKNAHLVTDQIEGLSTNMQLKASTVIDAENVRGNDMMSKMVNLMSLYLPYLAENTQIVMDGTSVAKVIARPVNDELNRITRHDRWQ